MAHYSKKRDIFAYLKPNYIIMKKIVFITGAGISAESGIKTFRDSDGLWEEYRVEDVATIEGYHRNPELVLNFYNERRAQLKDVKPNRAHELVAELEKKYEVVVVTQNVDDLHERAGSTNVIHLHGEFMKATSSYNPNNPKNIVTLESPDTKIKIGDKAKDGSQLRPFIVWFGEPVPMMEPAAKEVMDADIVVIVGTSLQVYPAASLFNYARSDAKLYLIDPRPAAIAYNLPIHIIAKGASEGMEELTTLLEK